MVAVAALVLVIVVVLPNSPAKAGVPGLLEELANVVMAKPPIVPVKLTGPVLGPEATTSPGIEGGLFTVLTAMSRAARAGPAIPMARIPTIAAMVMIRKRLFIY